MREVGVGEDEPNSVNGLYASILSAYSEPHRRYHGIGHLRSCFRILDTHFHAVPLRGAVEMALWFHDFVYDTHALNNEEKSAEEAVYAAEERLGLSAAFAQDVSDLILATKHQHPRGSVCADDHAFQPVLLATHALLDVDLSILGAQPDVFDEYERQIREEYSLVPEDAFRAGRVRILQEFLDRPRIFYNEAMRDALYEDRARGNLQRSLRALGAYAYTIQAQ